MNGHDGLIWSFRFDGRGGAERLDWDQIDEPPPDGGYAWIHLERSEPATQRWLREKSGLGSIEVDALLAEETRPRSTPVGDGLLLVLRGVNLNPGSEPEDMVSVRLFAEAKRVITVRRRRLMAIADIGDDTQAGVGPTSVGAFVAALADRLVDRMADVLTELDEGMDEVEAREDGLDVTERRHRLIDLRRRAIALRRHLAPQRDALARLVIEPMPWIAEAHRARLREVLDRTTRYVEDLEAARERAAVSQEELASRTAEELNRRMYALSIVAGIFLPLSFATGLLGINVGGIPGSDVDGAFGAVCVILALLAVGELYLFRKLRWL